MTRRRGRQPVGFEERRGVVLDPLHVFDDAIQLADVARPVVARGMAIDQWLERVAYLEALLIGCAAGPEPEHHVAERDSRRRPRHEHSASGSGTSLDHPAYLEQAHRLVDGGHRHSESLAQILLGAEPFAGLALVDDLALQLPRDELRPRHACAERGVWPGEH